MKVIIIVKIKEKERESPKHKYTEHTFNEIWNISQDFDFEGDLVLNLDNEDHLESFKIKNIEKIKVKL